MKNVYYIGGSPCAGKSTIAEKISEKYGFQYYKVDDFLVEFTEKGGNDGDEWLKNISEMSLDQLWLDRTPEKLCEEELVTYEKLFPYIIDELDKLDKNTSVITERAAFLPYLVNKLEVDKTHYICLVPAREFQIHYFQKRLPVWINDYLAPCSDSKKAFSNWMERDALFALLALKQAKKLGYQTLVVDGSKSVEENFQFCTDVFGL